MPSRHWHINAVQPKPSKVAPDIVSKTTIGPSLFGQVRRTIEPLIGSVNDHVRQIFDFGICFRVPNPCPFPETLPFGRLQPSRVVLFL